LMVILESFPPAFNVLLISGLAYLIFRHRHQNSSPDDLEDDGGGGSTFAAFAAFSVLQIVLNWVQFLRHRSIVGISTRNFPGYVHRFPSLTTSRDSREVNDDFEAVRASWKECESCDMHVPLLSHHCSHCRQCIYALDHHCYFLGHCVGRANLRFFIVFCLYAAVGSGMGAWNIFEVMTHHRNALSHELAYYLLPFTTLMYLMGSAQAWEMAYVGLLDFGIGAFTATCFFFGYGLYKVLHGDPRHEKLLASSKKQPTPKNEFTHVVKVRYDDEKEVTRWERFQTVFGGSLGILHFVTPFLPCGALEPAIEHGYRRIVTYNNDYIVNGMVHTSDHLLS